MRPMRMRNRRGLCRPSDAFLPLALLAATLLGRDAAARWLFFALYGVKLLALATSNGLRTAFARQPAMRWVQGSALVSLLLQLAGAAAAAPLAALVPGAPPALALAGCGLLLNIEHVFYEYLFAVGDGRSAALSRGITAVLALSGLLLCVPPEWAAPPAAFDPVWPLVTCGLSAGVAAVIGLCMGGRLKPRLNPEALRCAPASMLRTALYPALALAATLWAGLPIATFLPLFAGLALYEPCRSAFRRTGPEVPPLLRALLIACGLAALIALPFVTGWVAPDSALLRDIPWACAAVVLAAGCGVGMYAGNRGGRGSRE